MTNMDKFKELEDRLCEIKEPDPVCDCYANGPDDCWLWDQCKQKIEYVESEL